MSTKLNIKHEFDSKKMRHYLNDVVSVFHCHHYLTLFTQLAIDAEPFEGTKHLIDTSAETFNPILSKYFSDNNISSLEDKVSIVEEYFGFIGLGQLKITNLNENESTAEMLHSHVDEGWIKKWSTRKKSINFVGHGYLTAAISAIYNTSPGDYSVDEVQSIVSGADKSRFVLKKT